MVLVRRINFQILGVKGLHITDYKIVTSPATGGCKILLVPKQFLLVQD